MNVLLLLWQLEIDKLHVLLSSQANVLHESLQENFGASVSRGKLTSDLRVEDLRLFDTASDLEEFDNGLEILYGIDASQASAAVISKGYLRTYIGVPVNTQREVDFSSDAARATLVFAFRMVCPSSRTTRRHFTLSLSSTFPTPSSRSRASFP